MTIQPEKEVRFAVVMYGGVSLAIYINGVAQELLSLARATARSQGDGGVGYHWPNVSGVEAVYRKLGEFVKARFVVDILSGTSAGGINAVYLAKALVNDQNIDALKEMWIEQGDVGQFLNDKTSLKGLTGVSLSTPTASLLNSQRMYYKLLYALKGMQDKSAPVLADARSPYVEELDLYITATDLRGLALPVYRSRLDVAKELRFRNVFHFHYSTTEAAGGEPANDFVPANDPFLAFAARCTSSFPFVFEPMRLENIETLLGRGDFKEYKYQPEQWASFYKSYQNDNFPARAFGDGGYLDNKPFSYATSALNRRRRDLPVDRKLVYVEPAPELIDDDAREAAPPDAIENVRLALLSLPRSETIREDLQLVIERNDLIRGVQQIVGRIENLNILEGISIDAWLPSDHWRNQFLNELVASYGASYLVYHQLRVEEVLQNLRDMLARTLGWEQDSAQARDLSTLLHDWREAYYKTSSLEKDSNDGIQRKSENDILFRLDTGWRVRRLKYLMGLIDILANDLGDGKFAGREPKVHCILKRSQTEWPVNEANVQEYRAALLWAKERLSQAHIDLRAEGRQMRKRNLCASAASSDPDMDEYVRHLSGLKAFFDSKSRFGFSPMQLAELSQLSAAKTSGLPLTPDKEEYYAETLKRLEELTLAISQRESQPAHKGLLRKAVKNTITTARTVLGPDTPPEELTSLSSEAQMALEHVQKCLTYYYDRYEYFDMLIYPVTFGTHVGESDEVEIVRISPEDGVNILPRGKSATKLAGTKLWNFGAFFKREWRENDMLWGRLDAAECLIRAVLPDERDEALCNGLIAEAHQAILEDFQLTRDRTILQHALFGSKALQGEELQKALTNLMGGREELIENFKKGYQLDPEFPARETLPVLARTSSVLGQVFGGLTDKYPALYQPSGLFSRFGTIFFGLVSVAVPESLYNLLFRNLIGLVYVLELMMVAVGRVLVEFDTPNRGFDFNTLGTDMARLGARAFFVTLVAHLTIRALQRLMSGRVSLGRLMMRTIYALVALIVIGLLILLYFGLAFLGVVPSPEGWMGGSLDLLRQFIGP